MAYVEQVCEEFTGRRHRKSEKIPADSYRETADDSAVESLPEGLTKHLVVTAILSDFRGNTINKNHIKVCVESLIGDNGIEWVWSNRETVTDMIELHGFERKY